MNISRREFLAGALASAGYVLLNRHEGVAASEPSPPAGITKIKSLTYKIDYLTEFYTSSPAKDTIRIWIPLPAQDTEQEVRGLSIETRHTYKINRATDAAVAYIETTGIKKGNCATVRYTVKRKAAGIVDAAEGDVRKYLKLSEWEKWDDDIVRYVNAETGTETDPVRMARKLYDGIIDRTTYVHKLCSRGVSTLAFEDKAGRCDDFNAMFRTMMVYKNIPVKWIQGVILPLVPNNKGTIEADCINSHSWLEFHAGGKSIPVDLTEGKHWPALRDYFFGSLTANRIKFSTGRGLTLTPPQSEILNNFSYTHVEANGIPMIYGHNYRTFIKYKLIGKEM
ncbi:MAG: hypothetical protein HQL01_01450 [Nitrospirae bacterium]|nr:hypothetical protein [Nitrospirota bacterium]